MILWALALCMLILSALFGDVAFAVVAMALGAVMLVLILALPT